MFLAELASELLQPRRVWPVIALSANMSWKQGGTAEVLFVPDMDEGDFVFKC